MRLPVSLVVTTCHAYVDITVPKLLDSLAAAGVPAEDVIVVVCQAPDGPEGEALRARGFHTMPSTFMDATGLIYVAQHPELLRHEWVLNLQDTCEVRPDFSRRVATIFEALKALDPAEVDVVKLLDTFSMTTGFSRASWLVAERERLSALPRIVRTKEDIQRLRMHTEDAVFEGAKTLHLASYHDPRDRQVLGTARYTEDGPERIVEFYPVLGLIKYKSWYGQPVPSVVDADGTEYKDTPLGV